MARSGTAQLRRPPRAQGVLDAPRAALAGALAGHRGRRIAAILVGCAVAAAALYMLVARTPISAVTDVRIVGVTGVDARAIERTLEASALEMSTLSVDDEALLASVARFKVVRALQTHASFPHGLAIDVVEQLPAAVVDVNGDVTAVAGDRVVLGPALVTGSLPRIEGTFRLAEGRLSGVHAAGLLAIAGAAPRPLAAVVERIAYASHGITAWLRGGMQVYFGDGSLPRAKWISLDRVLSAASSHGASAIDVRVPAHPAAIFASGAAGSSTSPALTGEALISSLTEALATGGQTAGGSTAGTGSTTTGSTPSVTPEPQATAPAQGTAEPQPAG